MLMLDVLNLPLTSSRLMRTWDCLILPLLSLQPLLLGIVWAGVYVLLGYQGTFSIFIWITHLHLQLELVAERSIRRRLSQWNWGMRAA